MQTTIASNLSRLELHDSTIGRIIRNGNSWELTLNWAKLDSLLEEAIPEPIITGKINMAFSGVHSERFKVFKNAEEGPSVIPAPENFYHKSHLISKNEISDSDRTIKIYGFFRQNAQGMYDWIEWSFGFNTCTLSWSSHITRTAWLGGNLPAD